MHEGNPILNIQIGGNGASTVYLLNVPSFSSRYFNKIKRTSHLGRLLALSLEILCKMNRYVQILSMKCWYLKCGNSVKGEIENV